MAQAREQLGMSQEELAHRLNWDQATVSQRGKKVVSAFKLFI